MVPDPRSVNASLASGAAPDHHSFGAARRGIFEFVYSMCRRHSPLAHGLHQENVCCCAVNMTHGTSVVSARAGRCTITWQRGCILFS